ncbi:MAG: sugar phosphate nucleotidyltransferase [Anaerolineales bacterium]
MKVIIPLAGFGTRLRPHTWSRPKPLVNVAGKPVLGHILDMFEEMGIQDVVFIIGWLGDQIQEYVQSNYDFEAHYVVQKELKGQAHAIYLAREHLEGPCLIAFVDTLFEADLSGLSVDADGVLFVQEVDDPRRFGVIVEEGDRVVQLIEKPEGFEHRKAMIGVYYVQEGARLVDAIEHLLTHDMQTKGEYYLADAFQIMIDRGARIISRPVSVWEDCGKPETVLQTNRYLLEHGHTQEIETKNSVLVPPVHVARSAKVENAVVGPYVTVGEDVCITNAILCNVIVEDGSRIDNVILENSLIARRASIVGPIHQLNVGDDNRIDLS